MSRYILGIDPGKTLGWCVYDVQGRRVVEAGEVKDVDPLDRESWQTVRKTLADNVAYLDAVAIEGVGNFGGKLGKPLLQTATQVGRLAEMATFWGRRWTVITQPDVKRTICGRIDLKDGAVNDCIREHVGGDKGTKKAPGPLYGVGGHAWSAVAVAIAASIQLGWDHIGTRDTTTEGAA